ncbi:MAG: hemolysin family protein [Bacilli bacterium]
MSGQDIGYLVIIIVCLVLSALFSLLDMAFSSVKLSRLEREADKGNLKSKKALAFAKNYDETIATVLFGNDFVNILASSLASLLGKDLLEPLVGDFYSTLSSLILLLVLLIFCEILPKAIGNMLSYSISRHSVNIVSVFRIIFFPIVYPVNKLISKFTSHLAEKAGPESQVASDPELEQMVDEIKKEGIIDSEQSELLHRSLDFKETSCYEIMTPRIKVFGYDIETPFDDFLKEKDCFKHSRIIVFKKNMDHVIGYIPVKNLLKVLVQEKKPEVNKLTLPVVSVPRTMMISSALELMKHAKHHIAVVKDEYGGTEGIITMEDILEELVGDMWDEVDDPQQYIQPLKEKDTYLVDGPLNIDDFMNFFGIDPDKLSDDYSTVSGFILNQLGRFAKVGDEVKFENLDFKVVRVTEYTVALVKVKAYPKPDEDEEEEETEEDNQNLFDKIKDMREERKEKKQ